MNCGKSGKNNDSYYLRAVHTSNFTIYIWLLLLRLLRKCQCTNVTNVTLVTLPFISGSSTNVNTRMSQSRAAVQCTVVANDIHRGESEMASWEIVAMCNNDRVIPGRKNGSYVGEN